MLLPVAIAVLLILGPVFVQNVDPLIRWEVIRVQDRYGWDTTILYDGTYITIECISETLPTMCSSCVLELLPCRDNVPLQNVSVNGTQLVLNRGTTYRKGLFINETTIRPATYNCFVVEIDAATRRIIGQPKYPPPQDPFVIPYRMCPLDDNCPRPASCGPDARVFCYYRSSEKNRIVGCNEFVGEKACREASWKRREMYDPQRSCTSGDTTNSTPLCYSLPHSPLLLTDKECDPSITNVTFTRIDTGQRLTVADYVPWRIEYGDSYLRIPIIIHSSNLSAMDIICFVTLTFDDLPHGRGMINTSGRGKYTISVNRTRINDLSLASGQRVAQFRCVWQLTYHFYLFLVIFGEPTVTTNPSNFSSLTLPLVVKCEAKESRLLKPNLITSYLWQNDDTGRQVATSADVVLEERARFTCIVKMQFEGCSPFRQEVHVKYEISIDVNDLDYNWTTSSDVTSASIDPHQSTSNNYETSIDVGATKTGKRNTWAYFVAAACVFLLAVVVIVLVHRFYKRGDNEGSLFSVTVGESTADVSGRLDDSPVTRGRFKRGRYDKPSKSKLRSSRRPNKIEPMSELDKSKTISTDVDVEKKYQHERPTPKPGSKKATVCPVKK